MLQLITGQRPTSWKDLQNKVGEILTDCGFAVQVEKKIATVRGNVEIDVYAEEQINGRKYSLLCECKYWGTSIPQTIVHGFRTVISDIGSNIGYIITTSQYQAGAKETSENTNIELLTWEDFQNLFFESWYIKHFYRKIQQELYIAEDYNLVSWFDELTKEDKQLYSQIKNRLLDISEIKSYFPMPFLKELNEDLFHIPKLPLANNLYNISEYYGEVPLDILREPNYYEFLEKFISYGKQIMADFDRLNEKYKTK